LYGGCAGPAFSRGTHGMGAAETAIREARATFGKAAMVARKGEVVNPSSQ
jgi:hypothetical protein